MIIDEKTLHNLTAAAKARFSERWEEGVTGGGGSDDAMRYYERHSCFRNSYGTYRLTYYIGTNENVVSG